MNRSRIFLALALIVTFLVGGWTANAAANDPCETLFSSSTVEKLKDYDKCRFDRIEAKVDALTPKPTPTPTPTPTPKPTPTPTPTPKPTPTPTPTPKPTPTLSPTPTPTPAGCTQPNAASTGASGIRKARGGGVLGTGEIVQDATVTGDLEITGSGVTIRNTEVIGKILVRGANATMDHVTAKSIAISSTTGTKVLNSELVGSVEDAFHVTSDNGSMVRTVVIRGNWVHGPKPAAGAHHDGMQIRGVDGLLVECNVIDSEGYGDGYNAAIYSEPANGGNSNITVTKNWLRGYAFPVMVGGDGPTTWTGNRLLVGHWGEYCYGNGLTTTNFKSSGNVRDSDGSTVKLCGMG